MEQQIYKTVMMKPYDSVAVALENIPAGVQVNVVCQEKTFEIELMEPIEFGHKFAVVPISQGQDVLKYGEVIGGAVVDIQPGQHVHVHNIEGKRGRGDKVANQ